MKSTKKLDWLAKKGKGGNNEDLGIIIKIDMTAIKDKGIEVNLRDALLEAKESIEGKRKLNTLDNLIKELQKAAKEAPQPIGK